MPIQPRQNFYYYTEQGLNALSWASGLPKDEIKKMSDLTIIEIAIRELLLKKYDVNELGGYSNSSKERIEKIILLYEKYIKKISLIKKINYIVE